MIPKILHQTWKTGALEPRAQAWFDSWASFNPDLEHRFYSDEQCRHFIGAHAPEVLDLYDRLPFGVQRADLFRYVVVYVSGGLYADIDMECCASLTDIFTQAGAVLSIEAHVSAARQGELRYRRPYQLANCIFAAEPRHPFLGAVIQRLAALAVSPDLSCRTKVEDITGPRMLTRLYYEQNPQDVQVWRQTFLMPSRSYPRCFPFTRFVLTRHHFQGSWKASAERISLARRWRERDRLPNPFPTCKRQVFPHADNAHPAQLRSGS